MADYLELFLSGKFILSTAYELSGGSAVDKLRAIHESLLQAVFVLYIKLDVKSNF